MPPPQMASPPLDVCWICQTPSAPFSEDLTTIQKLAAQSRLNLGLALVGDEAPLPEFGTPHLSVVGLRQAVPSSSPPLTLSEDDAIAFASLLERLQVALGSEDEGELMIELAHLLMHLGPSFRPGALLRHPMVIQEMTDLHAQRGIGHTVTDTILIVNELLEVFQRTISMVDQVPEARLYHAVRGSYVGLIAALAAERFQSKFIFSDSLDPGDDVAPFWLNAMPHHWHSSLENSPLYRQLGERILMLSREILYRRSTHFLTPFPNQTDQAASHVQVVAPGVELSANTHAISKRKGTFVLGWLMPTVTLGMLEKLERVMSHVADLSEHWKLRLIEAAPHRRDWVCDLESWFQDHPTVADCFEEAVAYHPSELAKIDLLVALPGSGETVRDSVVDTDTGSEDASWIVLQALAAGVPLLATHTLKVWFTAKDAPGEFVSRQGDEKEAASALRRLAEDPERRAAHSNAGRNIAETQFSNIAVVETLSTLYTESLSASTHRRPTGIPTRTTASNWGVTKP